MIYHVDYMENQDYKIEFYQTPRGDCPANDFLESLANRPRMKTAAWLRLLQEKGPNLRRPYADMLQDAIRELRVSYGRLEIRMLYFIHGKRIVISHGFLKKQWATPHEEIEAAKRHHTLWLLKLGSEGR